MISENDCHAELVSASLVILDLIGDPVFFWIPAFAGMTIRS